MCKCGHHSVRHEDAAIFPLWLLQHQQLVQVLDEVGIDALTGAVSAPKTKVMQAEGQSQADQQDDDVNKLLESLRAS